MRTWRDIPEPHRHVAHSQWFSDAYGGDPYDGFVMKILPSGNGLADLSYATFLGGRDGSSARDSVGTQLPGTAYVTGITKSMDFPVTGTPYFGNIAGYQTRLSGTSNAFLSVIGQYPAGVTSLLYSRYLGGERYDAGLGVWFAQKNQIYVSGSTTSPNFPAQ